MNGMAHGYNNDQRNRIRIILLFFYFQLLFADISLASPIHEYVRVGVRVSTINRMEIEILVSR